MLLGSLDFACAQHAELVWVERDAVEHRVYVSSFVDDDWSEPTQPLVISEHAIAGTALSTDFQGNKVLVWTEQFKAKTRLFYMTKRVSGAWTDRQLLYSEGLENFAGSLVFDLNDTGWFFWSSADDGFANIRLMKFKNLVPQAAQIVSPKNNAPDIHPIAKLDQQGQVILEWTSFDRASNQYLQKERLFEVSYEVAQKLDGKNETALDSIPLPTFLPTNRRSLIHFPGNNMVQSTAVLQ